MDEIKPLENKTIPAAGGRGRGKRKPPRNPINLRPCEVCGAKASGIHFGAITCEACKSFFRRTCLKKLTYTCFGEDPRVKCSIRLVKGTASPCPACRMEKCLEINMSMDASKKGRYTHEIRAETINCSKNYWSGKEEPKDKKPRISEATSTMATSPAPNPHVAELSPLQLNSPIQEMNYCSPSSSTPSDEQITNYGLTSSPFGMNCLSPGSGPSSSDHGMNSSSPGCSTPTVVIIPGSGVSSSLPGSSTQLTVAAQSISLDGSTNKTECPFGYCEPSSSGVTDGSRDSQLQGGSDVTDPLEASMTSAGITSDDLGDVMVALATLQEELQADYPDLPDGLDDLNKIMSDVPNDSAELDSVVEQTITAFDKQNFITKGFLAKVPQMQYKFLKERDEKRKLFGEVEPVSRDEHVKLLEETGIDIDGRLGFFQMFISTLDPFIRQMISYLKCVPGFSTLHPDDQLAILTNTKVQQISTVFFSTMNIQEGIMTSPLMNNQTMDTELVSQMHEPGFFPEVQDITAKLQDLELTDHEYAMLTAVCIMQPNACRTDDGSIKCGQIQDKLRRALEKLISRRQEPNQVSATMNDIRIIELRYNKFAPLGNMSIKRVIEKFRKYLNLSSPLTQQWLNIEI